MASAGARCVLARRFFSSAKAHSFAEPTPFVGSWDPPRNPREAEARLAHLRREYKKQVKEVRKGFIEEVEQMRLDKHRRDQARREAIRAANDERKRAKVEAAKLRARETQEAQQQLRLTLLKERAEKLEMWRMVESNRIEKKKEKEEQLRRQSSRWIDESELEKKILEGMVDVTSL